MAIFFIGHWPLSTRGASLSLTQVQFFTSALLPKVADLVLHLSGLSLILQFMDYLKSKAEKTIMLCSRVANTSIKRYFQKASVLDSTF